MERGCKAYVDDVLPDSLVEDSLALTKATSGGMDSFMDDGGTCLQNIIDAFISEPPEITSAPCAVPQIDDLLQPSDLQILSNTSALDINRGYSDPKCVPKKQDYRQSTGPISLDSDSESSTSEDEVDGLEDVALQNRKKLPPPKRSDGDFLDIDPSYTPRLPRIPPRNSKLELLGKVTGLISGSVVIEALPNLPALDMGSALYLANRRPLGEVYDTMGPVKSPFYLVVHENTNRGGPKPRYRQPRRPNASSPPPPRETPQAIETVLCDDAKDAEKRAPEPPVKLSVEVNLGDSVFYAFDDPALSIPILCSELAKLRGSDASGQQDQELPPALQDCSDDEVERLQKRKMKSKRNASVLDEDANSSTGRRHQAPRRAVGHHLRQPPHSNSTSTSAATVFNNNRTNFQMDQPRSYAAPQWNQQPTLRPPFLAGDYSRPPPNPQSSSSSWNTAPTSWRQEQPTSYHPPPFSSATTWGPPTPNSSWGSCQQNQSYASFQHQQHSQAVPTYPTQQPSQSMGPQSSIFSPSPLPAFHAGGPPQVGAGWGQNCSNNNWEQQPQAPLAPPNWAMTTANNASSSSNAPSSDWWNSSVGSNDRGGSQGHLSWNQR